MSLLKFIVDTQLPPVLATYLRRKGLDATHTTHYPEAQFLSDSQIRKIAVEEDRIVITKDDDFADYFWAKGAPPRVLQLSVGNIRNNELVDLFEENMIQILTFFEENADFVIFGHASLVAY
ncbi:MAG TPA: hypothetical protein DCR35_11265 [Runella sp.]|nr:hypothetical protein [Runella sp.]HAO49826.1 hypothetical protein [Runella sp.]